MRPVEPRWAIGLLVGGVAIAGCAGKTPGAEPHAMSAAAHEDESRKHESIAEQHAADYRPQAAVERLSCAPGNTRRGPNATISITQDVCWTSVQNATEEHRAVAEQHRRHAADHRAASAALRDAEARACAGVGPDDRDTSPFQRTEDITNVKPLKLNEYDVRAGPRRGRLGGAVVTFRAVPGLSVEWLQHLVDCHLARNAALGHSVPDMPDCPLVPNDVDARVSSTGDGFAVAVSSDDPKVASQILLRAERLHATTRKDAVP